MFNTLAHLGHDHSSETINTMTALDHCMPIIIAGIAIIAILVGVIIYLLSAWQPKKRAAKTKTKHTK